MHKSAKVILMLATIACLVVFFSFSYTGSEENDTMIYTLRVGMPGSPWFVMTRGDAPGGATAETQFRITSISWLFLAGAAFLIYLRKKTTCAEK